MDKPVRQIPLLVYKVTFLCVALFAVIGAVGYRGLMDISAFVEEKTGEAISVNGLIQLVDIAVLILGALGILFFIVVFSVDTYRFFQSIKKAMKDALYERKLDENFTQLYNGRSFDAVKLNLTQLFALFKSFDKMKTTRISLEVASIKNVMNHISEGVLLINQEKVVTHANHMGEQMLRLIPGEIIGQAVSRQIGNKDFLGFLDKSLTFDQKIIEEKISIKEGKELTVSMFPIKDKFGEVVRVIVILSE